MSQSETQESENIGAEEECSIEDRESALERAIAFLLCLAALVLPMVIIENGYDEFTAQHGEAREGAAGAGLALAVVFRTVSRTVLRTIVRTSARAGVRASLKGAMKNVARTAIRTQTANILKKGVDENESETTKSNFKSLLFASALLYVSWVIVLSLGQPYKDLLNKEDSIAQEIQKQEEEEELRLKMAEPAIEAWNRQKAFHEEQQKLEGLRASLKGERDPTKQEKLRSEIELRKLAVTQANFEFNQAYQASNERIMNPNEHADREKKEPTAVENAIQYLMTYAPYPAEPETRTMVQISLQDIVIQDEEEVEKNIESLSLMVEITDASAIEKKQIEIEKSGMTYQINRSQKELKLGWSSLRSGLHFQIPETVKSVGTIVVDGNNVAFQEHSQKEKELIIKCNGRTSFTSPIIWAGGVVMFLPLWFMFFFQNRTAKMLGTTLRHETEWIGGGIQLYFAAAFSFMPLTSDVMADTTTKKRGLIALAGLVPPTIVSVLLWIVWKQTGNKMVLFVSDAFLIFPMVQIFPLDPLEGIHLWRWNKLGWLLAFFFIMGMFLFAGSEALKNVI